MGYTFKFMHGETYTANDVNDVFQKLTTPGVSLFSDNGDIFNDFNSAVASLTTQGVENSPDALKLTLSDGSYKILPGTAFMADGSTITVDNDGVVLEDVTEDAINYVYIKRRTAYNDITIEVSDSTWGNDDLPIAIIKADGSIADFRKYAEARVIPITAGLYKEFEYVSYPTSDNTSITVGQLTDEYISQETNIATFMPRLNGELQIEVSYLGSSLGLDKTATTRIYKSGIKIHETSVTIPKSSNGNYTETLVSIEANTEYTISVQCDYHLDVVARVFGKITDIMEDYVNVTS